MFKSKIFNSVMRYMLVAMLHCCQMLYGERMSF